MKKGFTLIELIAVIIIIGIIAILAVPPILNLVRGTRGQLSEAMQEIIFNAAGLYTSRYSNNYEMESGYIYCITIQQLVDNELLLEPVTDILKRLFVYVYDVFPEIFS